MLSLAGPRSRLILGPSTCCKTGLSTARPLPTQAKRVPCTSCSLTIPTSALPSVRPPHLTLGALLEQTTKTHSRPGGSLPSSQGESWAPLSTHAQKEQAHRLFPLSLWEQLAHNLCWAWPHPTLQVQSHLNITESIAACNCPVSLEPKGQVTPVLWSERKESRGAQCLPP
jgi:hypothetical protein